MNNSRKKNVLLNVIFGYVAQIITIILSFVGRKVFLDYLSVEYLGINGLYFNILTVLSIAEIGLDSALAYSLYKPIAEDNKPLISSLLKFFKKIYTTLAICVFFVGLAIIPFLTFIIKSELPQSDLIIYYILFLINTVATYFIGHKVALLSAYQEQRVQKTVSLLTNVLLQIMYIVVLVVWKNYYLYVVATVFTTILYNFILGQVSSRIHKDIYQCNINVEFDKKPIKQRIFSTFIYRIEMAAINNTDNILISILVSTVAVGLYSNYSSVIIAIQGFIGIINSALISSVGNLGASGKSSRQYEVFNLLLLFYHFVAALGGIGFSLLFNNLISVWLGSQYLFNQATVFIISFNFYISTATSPAWMYREANGLFKEVRLLMFIRVILNLVLSIVFGIIWGVFGIFFATAFSLILCDLWFEPILVFKKCFNSSCKDYWVKQTKYLLISIIAFVISYFAIFSLSNGVFMFIIKVIIVGIIVSLCFLLATFRTKEFEELKSVIKFRSKRKI